MAALLQKETAGGYTYTGWLLNMLAWLLRSTEKIPRDGGRNAKKLKVVIHNTG